LYSLLSPGFHWRGVIASCHFRVGWVGRGVAGLVGLEVLSGGV
jgi:hypothetical protein